jgi:surface protein
MGSMFKGAYLNTLNISKWDLSKVYNMSYMFDSCPVLMRVTMNNADLSSLVDTNHMFSNCPWITDVQMVSSVPKRVTNMSYMFYNCPKLTNIEVENDTDWKTQSTASSVNSSSMFLLDSMLPNWDGTVNNLRANTNWYFTGVRALHKYSVYLKI